MGLILALIIGGIIGSLIGSFLLGGFFGANGSLLNSPLDGGTLLAAFVGAVLLLAIVNLFRRGAVR
jgi:uncharacterized membrane protein YeaQ/YmgE (transglycosylase-associated protein family)